VREELGTAYIYTHMAELNRSCLTPLWRCDKRKKKSDQTSWACSMGPRRAASGPSPQVARGSDFRYANHGVDGTDKSSRTNGVSRGWKPRDTPAGLGWEEV
jgi:hypothetical protein